MAFSPKRAKAIKEGRVNFNIYDDKGLVYTGASFIVTVQMLDQLQKTNPGVKYSLKLEEVQNGEKV